MVAGTESLAFCFRVFWVGMVYGLLFTVSANYGSTVLYTDMERNDYDYYYYYYYYQYFYSYAAIASTVSPE
jgi:hypothetical protein